MTSSKMLVALAIYGLIYLLWAKQVDLDFDLTWQKGAPDGNLRDMIFMKTNSLGPKFDYIKVIMLK
jgi:hypothetical protein